MMPQPRHWGGFPHHKHCTLLCSWGVFSYTLGCMRSLEYMGFVPSYFSFEVWLHHSTNIIVHFTSSDYQKIKPLDKRMQKCLLKHLQEHFPISDNQWGFGEGKSTTRALLIAVDNITWHRLLEAGNGVCAVFFNHRKVFDGECLANCCG